MIHRRHDAPSAQDFFDARVGSVAPQIGQEIRGVIPEFTTQPRLIQVLNVIGRPAAPAAGGGHEIVGVQTHRRIKIDARNRLVDFERRIEHIVCAAQREVQP